MNSCRLQRVHSLTDKHTSVKAQVWLLAAVTQPGHSLHPWVHSEPYSHPVMTSHTHTQRHPNLGDMLHRQEINTFETMLHNRQLRTLRGHTFTAMCSFMKKKTKTTHDKWRLESTLLCSNSYRFHYIAVTIHTFNTDVGLEHWRHSFKTQYNAPQWLLGQLISINGTPIENTEESSVAVWSSHSPPLVLHKCMKIITVMNTNAV